MRASILTQKRARALRRKMTLPEILLWQELRGRKLNGLIFRRQHPIGAYILDFFCPSARLAMEIDGVSHEGRAEHDARRDAWLAEQGIRVLRIPAVDILKDDNMPNVLEAIERATAPSTAFGGPRASAQGRSQHRQKAPPPQSGGGGPSRSDGGGGSSPALSSPQWRGRVRASILTFKRARALRRKMTLPEILLWRELRARKLSGLSFRRQHPIGAYILDFFCPSAQLAVEIDGISHEGRAEHDARRDAWLAEQGIRVLRFPAVDILKDDNMPTVLASIERGAAPSTAFGGPPPPR